MTIPGAYNAGDVLTAANMNLLPAGRIGSASITADQASISTIADITNLSVTWTAVTGRYYLILLNGYLTTNSAGAGTTMNAFIRTGSTTIATHQYTAYTTGVSNGFMMFAVVSPGAGSVTYKASASCSSGTMTWGASSTIPSQLVVIDLGS